MGSDDKVHWNFMSLLVVALDDRGGKLEKLVGKG